ncbi:MAG: hypothetical protein ACI9NT_000669, partial [Bacteroidia bacterium]
MADSSVEHQQSNDRFALLVLGMHRSGTSAVTRVASLLGADLPKKLMVPKPGENESGFWESVELYDLQEELLASGGSSWDDWRPFNPNWLDSPAAEPFISRFVEHLQDDFAESALFVVKDPRCCRLMPVWRQILDNMGVDARVLLPVRNPLEVAESLSKRNGTSPARAYIIWLRHVLDAEHDSRGIPRLIFDYDDLLQDWRTFASQASQALAISWPADSAQTSAKIDAFLSSSHRHHTFDEDQLLAHPTVSKWVKNTYSALKMLAKDPESQKALRLLDKIRADFNDAGDTFGDVMASEEIVSQELQSRLVSSENSCELLQTQIDDVESRVIPLEEEKNSLEHHFAAKQSELEKLQAAMREKSLESAQVQQELADSKDRHEKDHSLMVSQFDEYRSLLVAKSEEDRRLLASKTEEDRSLLASQFEEDRSALVSQFENERSLKELYAGSRSDLLNRLNEIQMSSTWRLAESLYNIEVRRPWLVRWLGMSSVALRGFTVLHPVKHWRLHWDARVVQNLGLFDWEWYIEGNADVVAAGADPLKHWLREGWKDGRKP